MTKTKQATLFSLKSWKNVAAEGIQKCKNILADPDQTESEILKALASLKKKNPSKDVIKSSGIDLSLKLLERHKNPRVSYEARVLRNYWQLNVYDAIVIDKEEPPSKKLRALPEIEVCEIKTHKNVIECNGLQAVGNPREKQQTLPEIEVCEIFKTHKKPLECNGLQAVGNPREKQRTLPEIEVCEIFKTHKKTLEYNGLQAIGKPQEKQLFKKTDLMNTNRSVLAATKPTRLVFKQPTVKKTTRQNIMHQLNDAIQLFTRELGEQEVKLYLEKDLV